MSKMSAEHLQKMRSQLETVDGALAAVQEVLDKQMAKQQNELGDMVPMIRQLAEEMATHNVQIIYQHGESPIERLFFMSFIVGAVISNPFGVKLMGPEPDVEAAIAAYRAPLRRAAAMWTRVPATVYELPKKAYEATLAAALKEAREDQLGLDYLAFYDIIDRVGGWHAWHIMLQAGLPRVRIDGRGIRADGLAWLPMEDSKGIVLECDGLTTIAGRRTSPGTGCGIGRCGERATTSYATPAGRFTAIHWAPPWICGGRWKPSLARFAGRGTIRLPAGPEGSREVT